MFLTIIFIIEILLIIAILYLFGLARKQNQVNRAFKMGFEAIAKAIAKAPTQARAKSKRKK